MPAKVLVNLQQAATYITQLSQAQSIDCVANWTTIEMFHFIYTYFSMTHAHDKMDQASPTFLHCIQLDDGWGPRNEATMKGRQSSKSRNLWEYMGPRKTFEFFEFLRSDLRPLKLNKQTSYTVKQCTYSYTSSDLEPLQWKQLYLIFPALKHVSTSLTQPPQVWKVNFGTFTALKQACMCPTGPARRWKQLYLIFPGHPKTLC